VAASERPGAFALGTRGYLLEWLGHLAPGLADRYRWALLRAPGPDRAEALMHALAEDIARRAGLDAPGAGIGGLRAWLDDHVLPIQREQHMLRNAGFYLRSQRSAPVLKSAE